MRYVVANKEKGWCRVLLLGHLVRRNPSSENEKEVMCLPSLGEAEDRILLLVWYG